MRIAKFGIVGGSGVVVNQGIFMLLAATTLSVALRSPIAIFVALSSNFLLNNYWTWKDRVVTRKRDLTSRYFKFFISSGSTALLFNYLPLLYMVHTLRWNENIANIIGIGIASISNYFISHYWTFRHRDEPLPDEIQEICMIENHDPLHSIYYISTSQETLEIAIDSHALVGSIPSAAVSVFDTLPQGSMGTIKKGLYEETIAIEIVKKGWITLFDTIEVGGEMSVGNAFYSLENREFTQWWHNETRTLNQK